MITLLCKTSVFLLVFTAVNAGKYTPIDVEVPSGVSEIYTKERIALFDGRDVS